MSRTLAIKAARAQKDMAAAVGGRQTINAIEIGQRIIFPEKAPHRYSRSAGIPVRCFLSLIFGGRGNAPLHSFFGLHKCENC